MEEQNKEMVVKGCLVLDLDGTVRRSKSGRKFIKDAEDIEIIAGIFEGVKRYADSGYLIAYATNQGGVAWGLKTIEIIDQELKKTEELMGGLFNVGLSCFAHPEGKVKEFAFSSLWRKPHYGMLAGIEQRAYEELGVIIDWSESLMVGDMETDKECALAAGIDYMDVNDFLTHIQ